jgi:hypothetical protein
LDPTDRVFARPWDDDGFEGFAALCSLGPGVKKGPRGANNEQS